MAKRTRKPAAPKPPEWPQVWETFTPPMWHLDQIKNNQPSCVNCDVRVRRYRITVELIEEPEQVIQGRLVALWRGTKNHHLWGPLQHEARKYGLVFKSQDFGADARPGV